MAKRTKHYSTHRANDILDEANGSAELYNDDISRKAVGRLFNDDVRVDMEAEEEPVEEEYPEDEYAASVEEESEPVAEDSSYQEYINSVSEFSPDGRSRRDATKSPAYRKVSVPREEPVYHAKAPKRYETPEEAEYDDEDEEPQDGGMLFGLRLPVDFKLIALGAGAVMLVVMCFLIFKINSTGSQLKQLKADAEASKEYKSQNQTLLIEKEDLQNNVDRLTSENDALKAEIDSLRAEQEPPVTSEAPDEDDPDTIANGDNPSAGTGSGSGKMHTVAEGDNFWKIAMKYYNDGNRAEEIMKANNIDKPENLKIGTILMIP